MQVLPPLHPPSSLFAPHRDADAPAASASSAAQPGRSSLAIGISETNVNSIAACDPHALVHKFLGEGEGSRRRGGSQGQQKLL
jgi:hypothetical protein